MKTFSNFLLLIILFCSACNTKTNRPETATLSHQNEITISGAFALAPLMQIWVDEFKKTHPYVKFTITPNGSDLGQQEALKGNVDIGMVSNEIPKSADSLLQVVPVARLGVVPIINAKNPFLQEILHKGITREELVSLFTNQQPKTWGDMFGKPKNDAVNVYIRADSSGATKTLAKFLWVDQSEFQGNAIQGEAKLLDAVKNDPLALSYCNFIYTLDPATKQFRNDIRVLPVDFNQNGIIDGKEKITETAEQLQRAMWLGRYPCSLIRSLYLVTKGKPHTREVAEFLYWVITDGQNLVAPNGYIELYSSERQFLVNALQENLK